MIIKKIKKQGDKMVLDIFYDKKRDIIIRTTSSDLAVKVLETADYLFSISGYNLSAFISSTYDDHNKKEFITATEYLNTITDLK